MHKRFDFLHSTRGLRKLVTAAALAAAFCSAHAGEPAQQARNAGIADTASTAVGLALHAVELNPIGPLLGVAMKFGLYQYTKTLPDVQQPANFAVEASVWSGAAANNVCVVAAIVSGGAFAPACIAVGIAWGVKTWKDSAPERQLAMDCARRRRAENDPTLRCMVTPPEGGPAVATLPPPVVDPQPVPVTLAIEAP